MKPKQLMWLLVFVAGYLIYLANSRTPFEIAEGFISARNATGLSHHLATHPQIVDEVEKFEGNSLVHIASLNGARESCIDVLLRHGADPKKKNWLGETPFDLAKAGGASVKTLEFLAP